VGGIEEQVQALCAPIAEEMGLEVLAVELSGGRTLVLRVIVDRAGGVDCEALERFSRALSLQLDAADPIRGAYRLEVSSPGLDWPLKAPSDYLRWAGQRLRVQLKDGRTLLGRNLGPVGEDAFELRLDDGKTLKVALDEVARAVREPEF